MSGRVQGPRARAGAGGVGGGGGGRASFQLHRSGLDIAGQNSSTLITGPTRKLLPSIKQKSIPESKDHSKRKRRNASHELDRRASNVEAAQISEQSWLQATTGIDQGGGVRVDSQIRRQPGKLLLGWRGICQKRGNRRPASDYDRGDTTGNY